MSLARPLLIRSVVLSGVVCAALASCGRSELLEFSDADEEFSDGGPPDVIFPGDVFLGDVSPDDVVARKETGLPDVVPDTPVPPPRCGDGTCEPFEDCSNCPVDCGACPTTNCLDMLRCSITCSSPPNLVCISDCLAGACPSALATTTNVLRCATSNLSACGGGLTLTCLEEACPSEVTACLANTCTTP